MPRQPNPTTRRFRLHAKNIFLTYPQCPLPKEYALETLKQLHWTVVQPKYIRVAREEHQDGQPHLHVLIQLTGKCDIHDQRFFDIADDPELPGKKNRRIVVGTVIVLVGILILILILYVLNLTINK